MTEPRTPGRHFLQIPGPTNVPDRVLRAMARPVIDHRGPEFPPLALSILERLVEVFATTAPVVLFPSSGTGGWEAALVNILSPGDGVLMFETGHFAAMWCEVGRRLGLEVELLPGDWRSGVDAAAIESRLRADRHRRIRAVAVVHNETSTGVASDIAAVRRALDCAGHPALLLVDAISSLGAMEYRHDEWGVDVTVAGSQKGLMLPPGLGFNAISERARAAMAGARLPRSYWDWQPILSANERGFFPYTPATNLLFGLDEALTMLVEEEGLEAVCARHRRFAEATRRAVAGWGLELVAQNPEEYSPTLTAVMIPTGCDADALRQVILERFDMSLGTGLGKLQGRAFRIGHLGDLNELTLAGTLCGVEMGLGLAQVAHQSGGVMAALDYLARGDRE
ncbi:MAG: serine--glyoxylate aminotransferase [Gemmatimonadetes bacterium]|jgi:alanine-glyoxylate transaminase/serine-glyoxylate transaminase/serine-pyruvate transaminase|nr:serine--glyoxylate aminotransferase [Gemmatimonadota bacterium]